MKSAVYMLLWKCTVEGVFAFVAAAFVTSEDAVKLVIRSNFFSIMNKHSRGAWQRARGTQFPHHDSNQNA